MNTPRIFGLAIVGVAVALALRANCADAAFFYEYKTTVSITSFVSPTGGNTINGPDVGFGNTSSLSASPGNPATDPTFFLQSIEDTALQNGDHIAAPGDPIVLATDSFAHLTSTSVFFDFNFEIDLTLTAYASEINDDLTNPPLLPPGTIKIFGRVQSDGNTSSQTTTILDFGTDLPNGLFSSGSQPIQISDFTFKPPQVGEGDGKGSISAMLSDPNDGSAPEASSLAIWGVLGVLGLAARCVKNSRRAE